MSTPTRQDRWTEHQAASAALLAVMLLLVTSSTGLDGTSGRSCTHASASALHGVPGCILSEATLLPNRALLAPASKLMLGVGTRPSTAVQQDLSHLAGTGLLLARKRWNRPPPTAC